MDTIHEHALLWVKSGHRIQHLFAGNLDEMKNLLMQWLSARKTTLDQLVIMGVEDEKDFALMSTSETASMTTPRDDSRSMLIARVNHLKDLIQDKSREEVCGNYLLQSLYNRGLTWRKLIHSHNGRIDADICSFLASAVSDFDAGMGFDAFMKYEKSLISTMGRYEDQYAREVAREGPSRVQQRTDAIAMAQMFTETMNRDPNMAGAEILADTVNDVLARKESESRNAPVQRKALDKEPDVVGGGRETESKKENDGRKRV